MELIYGVTFTNEEVSLDGKHFVDCTLVNCVLEYSGQDVTFERTRLSGCRHVFYGKARSTVQLLQNVGLLQNTSGSWGEFNDRAN